MFGLKFKSGKGQIYNGWITFITVADYVKYKLNVHSF